MYVDRKFYKTIPKRFKNKWGILSIEDIVSDPSAHMGTRIFYNVRVTMIGQVLQKELMDFDTRICGVNVKEMSVQLDSGSTLIGDSENVTRLLFIDKERGLEFKDMYNEICRKEEIMVLDLELSYKATEKVFTSIMNKGKSHD